jgi:hypothetical protein
MAQTKKTAATKAAERLYIVTDSEGTEHKVIATSAKGALLTVPLRVGKDVNRGFVRVAGTVTKFRVPASDVMFGKAQF